MHTVSMHLRQLSPEERRKYLEKELCADLSAVSIDPMKLGDADQKNCEQMFGHVPIPIGYAGPLPVTLSSGECIEAHLPLATTEGALIASINRGCKAVRLSGAVKTEAKYHGITRSIAMKIRNQTLESRNTSEMKTVEIQKHANEWQGVGEATSSHLKIVKYDIDTHEDLLFLTIYADTDEAMGMNMVTIAAEAIGKWMEEHFDLQFITVAGNVDSDKKPSVRTRDRGRGYEVTATATISEAIIRSVLKTTPEVLLEVAHAKLEVGSEIAGALGKNCHAANIIAALYLATGQDIAHVVEGSLTNTIFSLHSSSVSIAVRIPALLVGIRGGGTGLPAQSQALRLLLSSLSYNLSPAKRLAEIIGAAVLAGELSLLAAQASHTLARSHQDLARTRI